MGTKIKVVSMLMIVDIDSFQKEGKKGRTSFPYRLRTPPCHRAWRYKKNVYATSDFFDFSYLECGRWVMNNNILFSLECSGIHYFQVWENGELA